MTDQVLQPNSVRSAVTFEDPAEITDIFCDPAEGSPNGDKPFKAPIERGRYKLPDPETGKETLYSRASTIAKTISNTYYLEKWNDRMIVKGMGSRPDLVELAGTTSLEEKYALEKIAEQARDTAGASKGSNHGTKLHDLTEYADRGEDLPPGTSREDEEGVQLYQEALREGDVTVLPNMMERVVLCREYNIVGRLDRVLKVNLDRLKGYSHLAASEDAEYVYMIGDLKTQKSMDFGVLDIAIQLAIYSHADLMWNEDTGEWENFPVGTNQGRGLIMHLPSTGKRCDLHWIDLIQGWEYVGLAMDVRRARNDKNLLHHVLGVDGDPWKRAIMGATSKEDLSRIWREATGKGEWNGRLEALGKQRLTAIRAGTDE